MKRSGEEKGRVKGDSFAVICMFSNCILQGVNEGYICTFESLFGKAQQRLNLAVFL